MCACQEPLVTNAGLLAGWFVPAPFVVPGKRHSLEASMKKWQCMVCGFIYDEAAGWPEDGIPAGTAWEDVPHDWLCPDCGTGKSDFEMMEIS